MQTALEARGVVITESEIAHIPKNTVHVSGAPAASLLKLLEALEDLDDVQRVVANFEMDDDEMATA